MTRHEGIAPAYELWRLLERERLRRGWTSVELARHLRMGRTTIDGLRLGRLPSVQTVNRIADFLGVDRQEAYALAGLLDIPDSDRPKPSEIADREIRNLLSRLPERRRRALERILDDERARYDREIRQAREDYERARQRIEAMARSELGDEHPSLD